MVKSVTIFYFVFAVASVSIAGNFSLDDVQKKAESLYNRKNGTSSILAKSYSNLPKRSTNTKIANSHGKLEELLKQCVFPTANSHITTERQGEIAIEMGKYLSKDKSLSFYKVEPGVFKEGNDTVTSCAIAIKKGKGKLLLMQAKYH